LTRHASSNATPSPPMISPLNVETYDDLLAMIAKYDFRERRQRKLRIGHFFLQTMLSIGCLVAIWFSPTYYVSFILMLISTLGFGAGVIDGLMGLLFYGSELRALREFEYEIRTARALGAQTGVDALK
jgi:sphingomyelin phosphodiesterase 2